MQQKCTYVFVDWNDYFQLAQALAQIIPAEEEQQKISLQTKEQLLQYKKEELEQMAEQKGIEVKQGMTKTDIVELLLQKE